MHRKTIPEATQMTLGEKIVKQRKDLEYTQEQLAEILGVSRQSVSKWESDLAYPETDKLIKMGKLFDCSMDYLLIDDITEKAEMGGLLHFWKHFTPQRRRNAGNEKARSCFLVCHCTILDGMPGAFLR